MSEILTSANQALIEQPNDAGNTQPDMKKWTKSFYTNRNQTGQEHREQELEFKLMYCLLLSAIQYFFTRLSQAGIIDLKSLDCPELQNLLSNGDFTPNLANIFSLEALKHLAGPEFKDIADAICFRYNRLTQHFLKGGVRVNPTSEKVRSNSSPATQARLQQGTDPDTATPKSHKPQAQPRANTAQNSFCENNETEVDDAAKEAPKSCSFYSQSPQHVNKGHLLVEQSRNNAFGPLEDASGIAELLQRVKADSSALSPQTAPSAQDLALTPASKENKGFYIGGVEHTELQLSTVMRTGKMYAICLSDSERLIRTVKASAVCPKCGAPIFMVDIKVVDIKTSWNMGGHRPDIFLIPVYRCKQVCEHKPGCEHQECVLEDYRFEPHFGEHAIDVFVSTDSDKLESELLPELYEIRANRTEKAIPGLLSKACYKFIIRNGVKRDLGSEPQTVCVKGKEVINPLYMLKNWEVAGFNQAFNKGRLSIGCISHLLGLRSTSLSQHAAFAYADKHFYLGAEKAEPPVDYDQFNSIFISFIRSYITPTLFEILNCLLNANQNATVHGDETPVKHRINDRSKCEQGYLWALISDPTAPFQGCFAWFYQNRNTNAFLDLLMHKDHFNLLKFVSDHFSAYESGLTILEQQYGANVVHGLCTVHARRCLKEALEQTPYLLPLYNSFTGKSESGSELIDLELFFDNMALYNKAPENWSLSLPKSVTLKPLTEVEQLSLAWYVFINQLFAVERMVKAQFTDHVSKEFREALRKARNEISVKLMAYIRQIIAILVQKHDCVLIKQDRNGNVRYQSKSSLPLSQAIIYWMNAWCKLCCFLDDPEIDISNNVAERMMRLPTIAKRNSMFFNSMDGAQAFASLHAMNHNCYMSDSSFEEYIVWLVCNVQNRLLRNEKQITAELRQWAEAGKADRPGMYLTMPHKRELVLEYDDGQKEKITYDMFDLDNNQTIYDLVDLTGLMPQDYQALLKELKASSMPAIKTAA